MRIVLVGQAAFAAEVLGRLLQDGHEVVAVYCPPDPAPDKIDPVKARALDFGIPVRQHASLKDPAVRQEWLELAPDLAVLAYVTQIVPREVFQVPRLGSICFHPSLLPRYRGGSAIPWQIIKGETKTGVTVFWVDDGIDTGPILLQKEALIDPDDTAATLYFNKLFPLGVEAVVESVRLISRGSAPRIPQDDALATYDPLCRDEHACVDWSQPIDRVYNLIRGCDPQPGAYNVVRGEKLRYFSARKVLEPAAFPPGSVLECNADGLVVAANGGRVVVGRLRYGAGAKRAAAEVAAELGLRPGDKLG